MQTFSARGRAHLPRARHRGTSLRGSPLLRTVLLGCLVTGVTATTGVVRAQDYDGDEPVAIGQVFPETLIASGQHRVTGVSRASIHYLAFDIESEAAGSQRAVSIPLALIRIQEARTLSQAVSQFRQDTRRQADAERGQINVRGESVADIVTSPLSTGADVVGQLGRNVGQTFEELGRFPGPQDTPMDAAGDGNTGDTVLAAHRRSVASQLNLDVYSSNPSVQRFLWAMARARAGGNARAGITTVSIARPPEVAVAGGRVQESIRIAVLNQEKGELFQRDAGRLEAAGVTEDLSMRLLEHPVLTPTHKSAITEYVAFMNGVGNRAALVEAALDAGNEVQALGKVQMARMYAYYHDGFTPLREFVASGHLPLAVNRDGALLMALPFDVLSWTPESDRVFTALARFAAEKGATSNAVLLSGIITQRAQAELEERGFRVFQRFLFRR